jgi:hypothetical protein
MHSGSSLVEKQIPLDRESIAATKQTGFEKKIGGEYFEPSQWRISLINEHILTPIIANCAAPKI